MSACSSEAFVLYMQKWLQGLEEEFFAQGDYEADLGLPITPFMDRALPGISSKQVRAAQAFHLRVTEQSKNCIGALQLVHSPFKHTWRVKACIYSSLMKDLKDDIQGSSPVHS